MILGTNFFQLNNAVFHYGLTPIQLAVYSYLVSCAGSKEKCWPGMKTIARHCGCSENAARGAVGVLAARHFISRVPTYQQGLAGRRRQTNNTYYILDLPELPIPQPTPPAVYREFPAEAAEKQ